MLSGGNKLREHRGNTSLQAVPSPRRSGMQRDLVCRHLQGMREAEAELQGHKGAPAVPKLECSSPRVDGEIDSEVAPIPANVRAPLTPPPLTLPTDLDDSKSPDVDEDSWKGEILPGFLYFGDRTMAADMDRLTTLKVPFPELSLPRRASLIAGPPSLTPLSLSHPSLF